MSPPVYRGMLDAARQTYARGGLRAFFVGMSPAMVRSVPANAAAFLGACVRVCMRACVRVCVCVCACICVRACGWQRDGGSLSDVDAGRARSIRGCDAHAAAVGLDVSSSSCVVIVAARPRVHSIVCGTVSAIHYSSAYIAHYSVLAQRRRGERTITLRSGGGSCSARRARCA